MQKDKSRRSWVFVDADIQRVDFPRDEFELACDVWIRAREGMVDPEHYGGGDWWGMDYIRQNLCHDFLSILSKERAYGDLPPIGDHDKAPTQEEFGLLDTIAQLLQNPDGHIDQLQSLELKAIGKK